MNVPPQPPPMSAPPPAPPQKSSALKWILIGCGIVGFIGLLVCGGCLLWGVSLAKSMIKVQEDVEALCKSNAEVREAIGDIREVKNLNDRDQDDSHEVTMRFRIKGTKGEGEVHARVKFTMTKFELKSAVFDTTDGRSITLK